MKKSLIIYVVLFSLGIIGIIKGYKNSCTLAVPRCLLHVQTGDIILSVGDSFKSRMVKIFETSSLDNVDYSHIGMFLRVKDSLFIVHMSIDDNCIKKENIHQFIVNNDVLEYDVFRMEASISHPNEIHFFLDSLISIGKPFDRTFNIKDEEAFYCTELVYKTFIQIGLSEIKEVKFDDYLYPNDFVNSGLFVKL